MQSCSPPSVTKVFPVDNKTQLRTTHDRVLLTSPCVEVYNVLYPLGHFHRPLNHESPLRAFPSCLVIGRYPHHIHDLQNKYGPVVAASKI
jgi:hypothetical protein